MPLAVDLSPGGKEGGVGMAFYERAFVLRSAHFHNYAVGRWHLPFRIKSCRVRELWYLVFQQTTQSLT